MNRLIIGNAGFIALMGGVISMRVELESLKWFGVKPKEFLCQVEGCPNSATEIVKIFFDDSRKTCLRPCVCGICAAKIYGNPRGYIETLRS